MLASRRIFDACLRKHLYSDRTQAEADLAALRRKAPAETSELFNIYRCGFCGGFHIGRRRRRRLTV